MTNEKQARPHGELLPLPGGNVAHLIAAQDAEIEALRAEVERDTALLRQALEALEEASDALHKGHPVRMHTQKAIAALRERLGEKE